MAKGGYHGDAMNGFLEQGKAETWSQVEEWLRTAALRHYPDSAFAKQELMRISSS